MNLKYSLALVCLVSLAYPGQSLPATGNKTSSPESKLPKSNHSPQSQNKDFENKPLPTSSLSPKESTAVPAASHNVLLSNPLTRSDSVVIPSNSSQTLGSVVTNLTSTEKPIQEKKDLPRSSNTDSNEAPSPPLPEVESQHTNNSVNKSNGPDITSNKTLVESAANDGQSDSPSPRVSSDDTKEKTPEKSVETTEEKKDLKTANNSSFREEVKTETKLTNPNDYAYSERSPTESSDVFFDSPDTNKENNGIIFETDEDKVSQDRNEGANSFSVEVNKKVPNNLYLMETETTNDKDSHFFAYFSSLLLTLGLCYAIYHNKNRIMALVLEGRRDRSSSRRNSGGISLRRRGRGGGGGGKYQPLHNNLEEVMTSNGDNTSSNLDRVY